jgi:hypothetical protein
MPHDCRETGPVVARAAVFVFSDRPDQLRSAVQDFEEVALTWPPLRNPRVTWDAATDRLVLEVDVTAEDRAAFGLERYAEFVADQAYKITFAAVAEPGNGGVRVLGINPV